MEMDTIFPFITFLHQHKQFIACYNTSLPVNVLHKLCIYMPWTGSPLALCTLFISYIYIYIYIIYIYIYWTVLSKKRWWITYKHWPNLLKIIIVQPTFKINRRQIRSEKQLFQEAQHADFCGKSIILLLY